MLLSAPALNAPLTFSHTTSAGRIASMASHMDAHSPERVPALMPLRAPAMDTSWQGEPPQITSTGSTCDQSTAVTSP